MRLRAEAGPRSESAIGCTSPQNLRRWISGLIKDIVRAMESWAPSPRMPSLKAVILETVRDDGVE